MTVQKTYNKNILTANGLSVSWPFTFELLNGTHLQVYVTTPEGLTTGPLTANLYAVDLQNKCVNYPLATINPVTLESVPPVPVQPGYKVTLIRATPLTQLTDLANGGTFNAEVLESTYDQQTMMIQDAFEKLDRATLADVSTSSNYQLPVPVASTLIGWNSEANKLINYNPAVLGGGNGGAYLDYLEIDSTQALTILQENKQINLTNASAITLTLPPAADSAGKHYRFTQSGSGSATIQGVGTVGADIEIEDAVYVNDLVVGVDVFTRVLTSGATHRVTYDKWYDGTALMINGQIYDRGVGMNGKNYDGVSTLPAPAITLNKNLAGFTRLRATIGKDNQQPNVGSPQFEVGVDGVAPFLLPGQTYTDGTDIDLDLSTWTTGNTLVLKVKRGATDTVYGVWGNLRLIRSISTVPGSTYEKIDNEDSVTLTQGESVHLFSDGTDWHSVSEGSDAGIPYQTVVGTTVLSSMDQGIINVAADADVTLTLPAAGDNEGTWYYLNQTGSGQVTLNTTYTTTESYVYLDNIVNGDHVITSAEAGTVANNQELNVWHDSATPMLDNAPQSHCVTFWVYNTYSGMEAGKWRLVGNLKNFNRITFKFGLDSNKVCGASTFNLRCFKWTGSAYVDVVNVTGTNAFQTQTYSGDLTGWASSSASFLEIQFVAAAYYANFWGVVSDIKLYYDAVDQQDYINDAHTLAFGNGTPVMVYSDGEKWQAVVYNEATGSHSALTGLTTGDDHTQYLNDARHATTDHSAVTGISEHTHPQSAITDLTTDLAGKAATVHTHAIADVADLQTSLDAKVTNGAVGVTVASLTDGKIPAAQLPESLTGSLLYKGLWDCSGGVYPTNPARGDYYVVGVAGTVSGTTYAVHDWMVYNGGAWDKIDNQSTVASVNGEIGAVVLDYTDVGAAATVHSHAHADLTLLDADDHAQYLNQTRHDALDHSTLTGVSGKLDETAHDLLDHTGLTGVGIGTTAHAAIDHTGIPGCGSAEGTSNHSFLVNLDADDHTQYLNVDRHYNADHAGALGVPSIAGLLDETTHDALDHSGLTGIPSVTGLLDETAHDLLDHAGLTGIPSVAGLLNETSHDLLDHTGLTGIPSTAGLLDETAHDALDHAGLTGVGISTTAHASIDHTGIPGVGGGGVTDHGALTGLADDDHTQYLNETRHDLLDHTGLPGVGGGGVTDHGALTGLADDDHTQYHTNARHAAVDHTGLMGALTVTGLCSYTHTQGTANATWTVNHNLNDYPLLNILDANNNPIDADVTYNSLNQATLAFAVAVAGTAKCYKAGANVYYGDLSLYVDAAVGSSGNGSSWADAYKTIAEANNRLGTYAMVAGHITVYIKTGTYAEALVAPPGLYAKSLSYAPDSGNVTVTGTSDWAGGGLHGASVVATYIPMSLTFGSGSYNIVCSPSSWLSSSHSGVYMLQCRYVNLWITCNLVSVTGVSKYGIFGNASTVNAQANTTISNSGNAIYANTCSNIFANVAGSTNPVVCLAQVGSTIRKHSSFSCTGTTAVSKTNGSQVINADGTLA